MVDVRLIGMKYLRKVFLICLGEYLKLTNGFLITTNLAWAIDIRNRIEDVSEYLRPERTIVSYNLM